MIGPRKRLEILNTAGIGDILVDVLVHMGKISGNEEEVTDAQYRGAALGIIAHLRTQYKKEMKSMEVASKQIYLKDAIALMQEQELRNKLREHGE
jgi:hypothetical protein